MTLHHRRFVAACACGLLAAAVPAVAGAQWTAPQQLGPAGFASDDTALASNDRGNAVTAFSQDGDIRIARATAGAPFEPAITVGNQGRAPRVAIDARGVALIAWEYDDQTVNGIPNERGTTTCCLGTKVVVWRPGHAPTRPRVVRRRGLITRLGPLAAVSGRRGLLVQTVSFNRKTGEETEGALQFAPVGIDGRPGTRRNVVRSTWQGASLQFHGGRAVVGLVRERSPTTRLAVRSQRSTGAFGALRVFLRVPERLVFNGGSPWTAEVVMAPDGRGGQVAALTRGTINRRFLQLVRKPRAGRLRSVVVRRGPARNLRVSMPAASPDGWAAVAFARVSAPQSTSATGYVVALRPSGRSIVTRVAQSAVFALPAVAVGRDGAGAAGFVGGDFAPGTSSPSRASFVPLAAGLPQPSAALVRDATETGIQNIVMTSNRRDRARVVWEEGRRILSSGLR